MSAPVRAALAAAVVALSVTVPAQAYRADRAEAVVAVPADGGTVLTPFVTSKGARYRLTVSGAYAHDAFGGLADCGYRDTNAALAGETWTPATGLLVNGAAAACGPYSPAHTYFLTVTGTGARLAFAVPADPTGHADNAGALTVAVETVLDVDAECRWTAQPVPGGTYVVLYALVAEAHQSGTGMAGTRTWVRCRADSGTGVSLTAEGEEAAPAVTATDETGTFLGQPETLVRCLEAGIVDAAGTPLVTRSFGCS